MNTLAVFHRTILSLVCLAGVAMAADGGGKFDLRGYGRITSGKPVEGPVTTQRLNFDDAAHAQRFVSKLYGDFELTPGNRVENCATPKGEADLLVLGDTGFLLPLVVAGSAEVVVLAGSDQKAVVAEAGRQVKAAPLRRAQMSHPLFMDKWDRYPIGVWQTVGDQEKVANHPGIEPFTKWSGEIGLNAQINIDKNAIDLVSCDNTTTWWRRYLKKNEVKYQRVEWLAHNLDLYNRNPFLTGTINPHVATVWAYYGERTMANSLLRDVQSANSLASLKPTLDDPNQMAVLDPDGEIGPFQADEWGLYGPTARREFARFLREVRGLSLDQVSNRYYGKPGVLGSWDDARLADWREFYGWKEGDSIDLAGEWRFMRDDEQVDFQEGWARPDFDDSGWVRLYYPGDALVYSLGAAHNEQAPKPLWMRKTFVLDKSKFANPQSGKTYLSLAPLTMKSVQVFVNGRPMGALDPNFHTALTQGQFDISDVVKAGGKICVALRCVDAPSGPVFITTRKMEGFPSPDPLLNARRWDQIEFVDWEIAQAVGSTLAAIRAVEPDRPIKVHAYSGSPWGWKTVATYGGFSHHTGSGAGWHFTEPKSYGASRGLQDSSEPGGPMGTLRDFKGIWGNLAFMGKNAHDYFISPQCIINDPEKLAYFEKKLPAIKIMGRANVMVSPIAVIRGTLNTKYEGDFAHEPDWRYGISPVRGGEMIPLLDEVRIREGDLDEFKVIIDQGTPGWDKEMADALRSYVEKGGILILHGLSGIHNFIDQNTKLGPMLAGVEWADPPAKGGAIAFTKEDPLLPGLKGDIRIEPRPGTSGHSLKPSPGTEALGFWPDGSAAFTARKLGRGMVYYCGETAYPKELCDIVAVTYGPKTFASTLGGGIDLLRAARSNNGGEELLMARGLGKEATISWTFEDAPERIYDPTTGETIDAEIKGHTATFKVTIPDWDFAWFAARRQGARTQFDHWLKRQRQMWSGVVKDCREPKVDLFRHLDLNHDWKLAQTDSMEQASALMKLDDQQAGLVPTELILWDAPGMKTRTGKDVAGLYRKTFDLPKFWRKNSAFALSLQGFNVHQSESLQGFGGNNEIFLNGVSVWKGRDLKKEWLEVGKFIKARGNRLEIVHQGNGIMPAIMLVRSAIPESTINLAGTWQAVENWRQETTATLPGQVKAAFVYRDVIVPAELKDREVWLRVDGPCPWLIVNGRKRYSDVPNDAPSYDVNVTPDIRFGEKNRIVLGSGNVKNLELCFYKPGSWSADGKGVRDALSARELADVAQDLSTIQAYPIVNPSPTGKRGESPLAHVDLNQPLKLPPTIVDLAFNTDKGLVIDQGTNQVPVTVTGTVEPFSEADGKIKGVYLRGESKSPGTLSLPGAIFRKMLGHQSHTFQVWIKPMAIDQSGGSLVNWCSSVFDWNIRNGQSTIMRQSYPERHMIVDCLINQRRWQCLTLVNDGEKGLLYVNGIPVGTQTWPSLFPDVDSPLCIGSIQAAREFINAKLALFTIYAGALNPDDVAKLYLRQRPDFVKDRSYAEDDDFRLRMTDKGAVDAAELSGTLTLGEGTTVIKEGDGYAMAFDGTASYLLLNDHPRVLLFGKPFELEVDFKPESGTQGMIFRRHHLLCLQLLKDGTLRFDARIGQNSWIDFPKAVVFDQWNRIKLQFDGKTVRLTANDKQFDEKEYPGGLSASSQPISFFADRWYPGFPKAGNIKGKIRELRVAPIFKSPEK